MNNIEKKYFLVKLRFHLGYSIRKPFASASIDSYIIPPKSTIIGAIAMANSTRNGMHLEYFYDKNKEEDIYSNAYRYKDCIEYVAYGYEYKPINFMGLTKMYLSLYNTRTNRTVEEMYRIRTGPLHVGMASYYNGLLKVFLVIGNKGECKITLDKKDLYSITRLGSKESVVSVVEVQDPKRNKIEIEKISKEKRRIYDIKFSFPKDMKGININSIIGSYFIENVIEDEEGITYSFSEPLKTDRLIIKTYIVPNPTVSVTTTGDESLCLFKTPEGNIIAPGELC